jgi:hypothetical protein
MMALAVVEPDPIVALSNRARNPCTDCHSLQVSAG